MNANRSSIRILIFTAVFFTGAAALAQAQQPGTGSQPMPSQQPQQQTSPGGLNGAATANAASPGDQMFVQSISSKSDAAEVQLGQLAQQKSQSDDVKQLGQKMVLNCNSGSTSSSSPLPTSLTFPSLRTPQRRISS